MEMTETFRGRNRDNLLEFFHKNLQFFLLWNFRVIDKDFQIKGIGTGLHICSFRSLSKYLKIQLDKQIFSKKKTSKYIFNFILNFFVVFEIL